MSLPQLLLPAPTPQGFTEWTWTHLNHHKAIIAATLQTKNIQLALYQIWPVNPENLEGFLLQHQQQHDAMNQVYGVAGNDLSTLDWKNKRAVDAFFFLHFGEHAAVAARCGLPI
jgi:hypothetical protein